MGDVAALGVLRVDLGPGILWPQVRARRCLFGAPDPKSTQELLENESKKLQEQNKERWNFDFVQGKPLSNGRFAWTAVSGDAPSEDEDDASAEKDGDESSSSTEPTGASQTRITDFMRKRKSSSHQKEEEADTSEPKSKTRRRFST